MFKKRKSLRLKNFNYASKGAYFLTICIQSKAQLLGTITDGVMQLNEYGQMIGDEWMKTPTLRPNVILDEFMIMPDHFHAIIFIGERMDNYQGWGVCQYAPTDNKFQSPSQTIGAIVRGFKSATTTQINNRRNTPKQLVWQRNYYERIIRDEMELNQMREYIQNNPRMADT